jgi:hypothetical protein
MLISERQIGTRMPAELVKALEVAARAEGVSVADVVRRACRAYIAATAAQLAEEGPDDARGDA